MEEKDGRDPMKDKEDSDDQGVTKMGGCYGGGMGTTQLGAELENKL